MRDEFALQVIGESAVREVAYSALVLCEPEPAGVTREGVLAGDEEMLEAWRRRMDWDWGDEGKAAKGVKGKPGSKLGGSRKRKDG